MDKNCKNSVRFNSLYKQYKAPFTAFALSYLHDVDAAEDVFAESMMLFWEKQDSLPEDTNIPAYILTTIKNKSLNYLRHEKIRMEAEGIMLEQQERIFNFRISSLEACDPSDIYSQELQSLIRRSLGQMPEKTSEIFLKSRFKNKTNKEIAEEYNISVKSVEYHITKAIKILKTDLKDYLPLLVLFYFHF